MVEDSIDNYRLVIIGGSAGSLEVILKIVAALPVQSNASFVIIVHRKNDADSILADLLSTRTSMPVKEVEDKESIHINTIYIAAPDYHLLFESRQSFSLDSSEKIHYSRPSIDVAFESAAHVFGKSVIGILLSGSNADGANGLKIIKQSRGFSIIQNPASTDFGYMPQRAIDLINADAILDGDQIGEFVKRLLAPL